MSGSEDGEYNKVWIGIQARSTSERFPRKVFELIGDKPMLQHVIDAAENAARYMSRRGVDRAGMPWSTGMNSGVVVLTPVGDEIVKEFSKRAEIIEGPEQDVLARYLILAEKKDADYIVRITADCPLIPAFVISKLINIAVKNRYDYVSNVDESLRTSPDGMDCEVMSRRMIEFINIHAKTQSDREHVTTFIRRERDLLKEWGARLGTSIGYLDLSPVKLSVDTIEDLARVRDAYSKIERALMLATGQFGRHHVHRF